MNNKNCIHYQGEKSSLGPTALYICIISEIRDITDMFLIKMPTKDTISFIHTFLFPYESFKLL